MIVVFTSPQEKELFNDIVDVFDCPLDEIQPFYSAYYVKSYAWDDFDLETVLDVISFYLMREKERGYGNGRKSEILDSNFISGVDG